MMPIGRDAIIRAMILDGYDLAAISTILLARFSDVAEVARRIRSEQAEAIEAALANADEIPPGKLGKITAEIKEQHRIDEADGNPMAWRKRSRGKERPRATAPASVCRLPHPREWGYENPPE